MHALHGLLTWSNHVDHVGPNGRKVEDVLYHLADTLTRISAHYAVPGRQQKYFVARFQVTEFR